MNDIHRPRMSFDVNDTHIFLDETPPELDAFRGTMLSILDDYRDANNHESTQEY